MKNNRSISKLLLRKSNSYLKLSITIFAITLVLGSTATIFFINQYIQMQKDFINNNNTHIIEIDSQQISSLNVEGLKFSDEAEINLKIQKQFPEIKYNMYKEYQMNFGILDENENNYFIYGLDETAGSLLGNCKLELDTTYAKKISQEVTILKLPIINVEAGGFSSNGVIDYSVKNKAGVAENNPFSLFGGDMDKIYVGSNTYKKIIEKCYNMKWDEFTKEYDKGTNYGVKALGKFYIYVDDLYQVESIAKLVSEIGYNTNYTFKAFDNFDNSIKNTIGIIILLAIIILLITTLHVILSFNSYLKVQQKDMGILKQMGYEVSDIRKIYTSNVNEVFVKVAMFILMYILMVGLIFIITDTIIYILYVMISVLIILMLVNRIIIMIIVKGYANKDIISLLKVNKEFE